MIPAGFRKKLSLILGAVLAAGIPYGIMAFFREFPASSAELILPAAAFLAAGILFRKNAFFSSALVAVFSFTLLAATLIITETVWVEFSTEFPDIVFYEPLKSKALHAWMTFTCILSLFALMRTPSGWTWAAPTREETAFARSTWWLFLLASLVIAMLNIRGPLITQAGYHSEEWLLHGGEFNPGLDALWTILGISGVSAALRGYGVRHRNFYLAMIVLLASMVYFRLLRGERATALGFIIFLSLLYYTLSSSKKKDLVILSLIPAALLFLIVWANVRGQAVELGLGRAFSQGLGAATEDIREGSVMKLDRAPKLTWDMMETAFLYENGVRRSGQTYWNLIPQTVPSFVCELLEYERPLSEPWILAQYFQHGGGIFIVAEAYWNFGFAGAIGLALALGFICTAVERLYRWLPPVLSYGYYGTIVISAENVLVGSQAFIRGLEIALFVTALGWLLIQVSNRVTSRRSPPLKQAMDK